MLTFLRTMYAPAMLYALPAMATDEENLASVQASMVTTALQKMGAAKTTPTAIRHGPVELGGLNIIDLRTELGISNLKLLRTAIYTDSEVGKLLVMSLKYTQLEAGISSNLLEQPGTHISYITPTWITSLRQFLFQHNLSVNITDTLRIRYSNQFDCCIMESEALRRYTPVQQRDINLVRLHLQVLTLSDLSTPDGYNIWEVYLSGKRKAGQKLRTHWPRQTDPTSAQRRLWRKFISSSYLRYGTKWRSPLGSSLPQKRPLHQEIPSIVSLPQLHRGNESASLHEYIARLPRWHTRLLSQWKQESTDLQVWRAFRSRQRITIASDGGLRHRLGTHGWKIVAQSGSTLFSGSGPIDGPLDISHSARSELGGLTAPLLLVLSLAKYWGLHHRCRYRWLTDSKAAISKVNVITKPNYFHRRYPDDVDYVTAIKELHGALRGRKLRPTWIKGHQDETHSYDELSPDARLNVDVDELASAHFLTGTGTRPTPRIMHLQEHKVTIAINGVIYPTRIDEQIRYHINGSYIKEQIQRQQGWNETTWNKIDFTAFGRHFKTLSNPKRVQHMKFVHNLQPIGANQERIIRHQDDSMFKCPCCRAHDETQQHLLLCACNPARAKAIKALQTASKKSDGTKFSQVLGDILQQWLTRPDHTPSLETRINPFLRYEYYPQEYVDLIHTALAEQKEIGWLNMFRGFLTEKWHQVASSHFGPDDKPDEIINRNDGANRVHRMIKIIYTFTHDIWHGRNEALHGIHNDKETQRLSALDTEITQYHSEPSLVLTDDKFYCETSLQRLLSSSTANKRRWLLRVKASRGRKAALHTQQPRITKFFTPLAHIQPQTDNSTKPTKKSDRNKSTQQIMHQTTHERDPSRLQLTRSTTTQQLLTKFLKERASNPNLQGTTVTSPSPSTNVIG